MGVVSEVDEGVGLRVSNDDHIAASAAVATILLLILVVPIVFFQNAQAKAEEQGR